MSKKSSTKTSNLKVYFLVVAAVTISGMLAYALIVTANTRKQTSQTTSKTENKNSVNAYASIPDSDIQLISSEGDFYWDTKNPYYFYDQAPVVALVHIDSIDGGRNYSPIYEQYTYPQTIGKMTVRQVYKGDVKAKQRLTYSRLGGILTYDEYFKGLSKAEQSKINYLSKGEKSTEKYVKTKFIDDIDIETGKDYIVFLRPLTSKDGKYQEYTIDGMQYGLREVRGTSDEMKVLNNETRAWENPDTILRRG